MKPGLLLAVLALGCYENDDGAAIEIPADTSTLTVNVTPTAVAVETCTACGGDCQAERLEYDPAKHVAEPIPLEYYDEPAAGGPHDPCWSTWGAHDDVVGERHFVHNLEHGGVVFLYDCSLPGAGGNPGGTDAACLADVSKLKALVRSLDTWALSTEFPGMTRHFGAVAWNHRLLSDCYDAAALQAFYDANKGHGPESLTSGPPSNCPQ